MCRVRSLLDLLAFVGDGLLFDRVVRDEDGLLLPLVAGLLPLLLLESALIFVSFSPLALLFLTTGDLLRDFFLEEFGLRFMPTKEISPSFPFSADSGHNRSSLGPGLQVCRHRS